MLAPHLNAALPGTVGLGRLRLPVFALFATAGLIAALALSQRTARRMGLLPDGLWDAGIIAVASAFVASRLLLVVQNFRIFRVVPLLVLALPSITYTGLLMTAIATALYLRWKRIPLLRTLDAWTPCAALLAAFLELGHFFEGTAAGMPTAMPWGVIAPGDTVLGRTVPVQLLGFALALGLCGWFYRKTGGPNGVDVEPVTGRIDKQVFSLRPAPGRVAALGLMLGGTASFLLDFLRQPVAQDASLPLDPSQLAALAAVVGGCILWLAGLTDRNPASSTSAAKERHAL